MAISPTNQFALLVDEDDGDDVEAIVSRLAVSEAAKAAAAAEEEALAAEEKKKNGRAHRNGSSDNVRDERKGGRHYQKNYGGGDYDQNYGENYYQQNYENHGGRDGYQMNHGGREGHRKSHGGRDGYQQNRVDGYSQGSGRGRNNGGGGQGRGPYRGRVFNDNQGYVNGNQRSGNVEQGFVRNNGVEKAGQEFVEEDGWYAVRQFRGTNGGGRGRSGNNGGNREYRVKTGGKISDNSVTSNTCEAPETSNGDIAVNVHENGPNTEETVPENTVELAKAKEEESGEKAEREARRKELEEEAKKMTLVEYEKRNLEKRKAMDSLGNDKRKVTLDKDFESMQIVDKKGEEGLPMKLKSEEKLKRKDSQYKEDKVRKVVHINEFLRHANGGARRPANGSRGVDRRGRVSGERGSRNPAGEDVGRVRVTGERGGSNSVVQIEDPRQFPGLEAVVKA